MLNWMKRRQKSKSDMRLESSWSLVWELLLPHRALMALALFLLLINRLASLVMPYAPKILLDRIIGKREFHLLTPLIVVVFISTMVQAFSAYALMQLTAKEGQKMIAAMRRRVQAHVIRLPLSYYDANKVGGLLTRVLGDVSGVRNLIGAGLIEFIGGIITAVFVLIILLRMSVLMTVVALGFLLLLTFISKRLLGRVRVIFRDGSRIGAEVAGRLNESFGGVRVVKGYHAEEREIKAFGLGVDRILQNSLKGIKTGSLMSIVATLDLRVLSSVILFIGAKHVLANKMTPGELFSYLAYLAYVIAPITQLSGLGTQISEALAGLDRTRDLLNERPEEDDPERTLNLPEIAGYVRFEQVQFEYQAGKPVLRGITFEAQPGSVTALVGSSGSGKSTIIGLVAAFYKTTGGHVLIDGVDLNQVRLDSYRRTLGIVLQESFLFDGTIWENVAFSRPGATEEEVLNACKMAHVDEFAERLKDKYQTVIGERGVRLSGGQRQRISIARAVVADPRILILDEATSSLDSESEALIQQGLRYLMKGRTTFVIAHRLSTVRQADQILVIESGGILERGTHQSLFAQKGRYFKLYTQQHGFESNRLLDASSENSPELKEQAPAGLFLDEQSPDPVGLAEGTSISIKP